MTDKLRKEWELLNRVKNFLDALDAGQSNLTVVQLKKAIDDLELLIKKYGDEPEIDTVKVMRNALKDIYDAEMKSRRLVLDFEREMNKIVKKSLRTMIDMINQPKVEVALCIRCDKKPKHFGDYCKRCADELGTRPTGKVT